MKILITGINGFIGSNIGKVLESKGFEVTGCGRRKSKDFNTIEVDFAKDNDINLWQQRVRGFDVVINAVGIIGESKNNKFEHVHCNTPKAIFKACEIEKVKKVVQISALGADDGARSNYHKTKKQADDYLRMLDLDYTIMQPSVVYGKNGKSTEMFLKLSALPVIGLIGAGSQKFQPIYIDDLVSSVVNTIEKGKCRKETIIAVGADVVTYRELLRGYREGLGFKKMLTINVPMIFIRAVAFFGNYLNNSPINSEALDMLERGNIGSVEEFYNKTNVKSRCFNDGVQDMELNDNDRLGARLAIVLPLLKVSLAFIFMFTAVVSILIYPRTESYALLNEVGISADYYNIFLYGASIIDFLLGVLILIPKTAKMSALLMMALICIFTLIITINIPMMWFEPFGPVFKNIVILAAIAVVFMAEKPRQGF